MQLRKLPNYPRSPAARRSLHEAFSHGADTYANRQRVAPTAYRLLDEWVRVGPREEVTNVAMSGGNFSYQYLGTQHRLITNLGLPNWTGGAGSPGGFPPPPAAHWALSIIVIYIYDGNRVIQERDGSNNNPLTSYVRGPDLSGTFEGAGGIGGLLARSSGYSSGNWTTNNYYHADGNGNITYLVNSGQTAAASYRYDPFGRLISSSGAYAAANVYRFSSKEFMVNSGLYYYLYRFYDPNLQRWINRDLIDELGFLVSHDIGYFLRAGKLAELNAYTFDSNDPDDLFDPDGLQECPYYVCFPVPCAPGTFGFCAINCAKRGLGVPIAAPICAVCWGKNGASYVVGCPCSGILKRFFR